MDAGVWKMQEEARLRVATRRARERRIAMEQTRRVGEGTFDRKRQETDPEQLLLLMLSLLLAQSGADRMLVLAILYLAI